jgi:hypothetical protein
MTADKPEYLHPFENDIQPAPDGCAVLSIITKAREEAQATLASVVDYAGLGRFVKDNTNSLAAAVDALDALRPVLPDMSFLSTIGQDQLTAAKSVLSLPDLDIGQPLIDAMRSLCSPVGEHSLGLRTFSIDNYLVDSLTRAMDMSSVFIPWKAQADQAYEAVARLLPDFQEFVRSFGLCMSGLDLHWPELDAFSTDVFTAHKGGDAAAARRLAERIRWTPNRWQRDAIRLRARIQGRSPQEVYREALTQGVPAACLIRLSMQTPAARASPQLPLVILSEEEEKEYELYRFKSRLPVHLTGQTEGRKSNVVIIGGHEVILPDAQFKLFLRLVVALYESDDGFVYRGRMNEKGGLADEGIYFAEQLDQAVSRLRYRLAPALEGLKGTEYIQVQRRKIRLSIHRAFVSADREILLRHPNRKIRSLAARLPEDSAHSLST